MTNAANQEQSRSGADTPPTPSDAPATWPRRWSRIALGYVAIVSAQIGFWALFAPRSFYDDFPGLGRAWVSTDGPYNEHLVRDVGALNLALAAFFVVAWVRPRRTIVTAAGIVALVWGAPHAVYHLFHTESLDTVDVVASVGGLLLFAVVGSGLIWAARSLNGSPQ